MRTWLAVGGAVACVVLLATQITLPKRNTDLTAFPLLTDATLADRTVVDFSAPQEGIVSYSYLGATVPEILADNEVPELRNETSYTRLVDVSGDGEDALLTLSTVIYSQPAYAQDADGSWRYLEYATTTEQAFRNRGTSLLQALREVFVRTAYADTVSPFSGAGDGRVMGTDGFGDNANYIGTVTDAGVGCAQDFEDAITISVYQSFFVFDSSTIPLGSTISSASLNVYVTLKSNGSNDGSDLIGAVQSTQATHTELTVADFDAVGTTYAHDAGQRKDITSISTSAYLTFTFNATGMGFIRADTQSSSCSATSGITCLALRLLRDIANTEAGICGGTSTYTENSITMSTSENTGTSQDPYLSVTYTAPAASVPVRGSGKLLPGGVFRVVGGKLKIQ